MSKQDKKVTIKRRVVVSLRLIKQAWALRPWAVVTYFLGAFLEISGSIGATFATAKLGGILAAFVGGGSSEGIWFWLGIDVFATVLIGFGFLLMSHAQRLLYFVFVEWSTAVYMETISSIDIHEFYDKKTRNLINKVSGGYSWQISLAAESNLTLIYSIGRFLAITLVISQIVWWIVPVIALFLIPSLIAESRIAQTLWFVWDQKGDQRHIFWGLDWILKRAKNQMEIRSTQSKKYLLNKVNSMTSDFYREQEKQFNKAEKFLIPTKFSEVAGVAIGSVVLIRQLLARTISFDHYLFLSGTLLRSAGALNTIFQTLSSMQERLLFADSFFELIDTEPEIVDIPTAKDVEGNEIEIEFRNVSFTYPDQTRPIFSGLNLTIKPGEHVAVVGENGAGKTTLIKLLLRFYKPNSGEILVNGIDLNEIKIDSWYSKLGTLFQEFNQYPFPIDENIWVGRSSNQPNKKQLEKAARFGGVDTMIKDLEYGWETVLDSSFKKGEEPSGGQWQRVALARAFYRQADVIILDEPTSSIDAKAEYKIFNSIFDEYKNKTAIIVSHRFSTVRRANRIIVVDQGKIMEEGSHEKLMKTKGMYYELFTKQAEGYK
ncbi:MAG: ABC transporter ATP-binding protein/permease [bacterium]|nr:ABC transporter ATP-binding protein/permease [bacterium]